MPLKVTDRTGEGDSLHVAAAIAYAVNNGARVINISLGGDAYSPAEKAAVEFARRKGVVVVVAAGNQGASADAFWPAALPGVITVAATEPGGARTAYSNWGSAVDIAAPGSKILSLRAAGTDPMALVDDKYTALANVVGEDGLLYHATGTSFAAPYVAGVASLLLSLDDALTAQQVERMLLHTATDIETPGIDALTGYGALNARAALDARPDFFIDATITGVALAPAGDAVQVLGTADADRFTRAVIELGEGENPTAWQSVGKLKRAVRAGVLASIPTSTLAGAARWTLRVTTTHRDGQERVGLLPLALQ
jgi:subtilisin family serine protease